MSLIGIVNSFSAGLFFSMAFIHIIPEADEQLKEYFEGRIEFEHYPFAFFFATLSYMFVLVVEKIFFDSHALLEIHVHPHEHNHSGHHSDHKSHNHSLNYESILQFLTKASMKRKRSSEEDVSLKKPIDKTDSNRIQSANNEEHHLVQIDKKVQNKPN